MQVGFACLEAGCVQPKNVTNILLKNVLDLCKYKTFITFSYLPNLTVWINNNFVTTHGDVSSRRVAVENLQVILIINRL